MTITKESPEAATNGALNKHIKAQIHNNQTPFQKLQSGLSYCRQSGPDPNQHVARCPGPTHKHGDLNPSLFIYETEDKTILLHCKAGCRVDEILAAAGLEFKDLYPDPDPAHRSPIPKGKRWNFRGLLKQLDHEALDILCAANAMQQRDLTPDEFQRLEQATIRVARIAEAAR